VFCFFQAEDGIRDLVRSRGLGDVYKRQSLSVSDLIGIMRDTADTTEDGRRFLIHPVDAIAAVQARTG